MGYGVTARIYLAIDRLLSDSRYEVRRDGTIWTTKGLGNTRHPVEWRRCETLNGHGYMQIKYNGIVIDTHRIVYRKYHGQLIEGLKVDHKDDNKCNNYPSNLQQITTAGNRRKGKGIRLSVELAEEIRSLRSNGFKLTEIEIQLGVPFREVSRICKGDRWNAEI